MSKLTFDCCACYDTPAGRVFCVQHQRVNRLLAIEPEPPPLLQLDDDDDREAVRQRHLAKAGITNHKQQETR